MRDAITWTILSLGLALVITPVAAQETAPTAQSSASPQPTLPKSMPKLTFPDSGLGTQTPSKKSASHQHRRHHLYAERGGAVPLSRRPALANVELVEPLPHPPQPPHVVVPVPAYPLENFVTNYTTPPPPVVCAPTRYDRFKPDFHLVDEKPVLCTADNP